MSASPEFGDTRGATQSANPTSVCSGSWFADDVWFSVILGNEVPENGINVEIIFDPIDDPDNVPAVGVAIYNGCGVNELPVACFSDGTGSLNLSFASEACLTADEEIFIRVWSGGSPTANSGTFEIIAYEADPRPPFDRPFFFFEDFNDGIDGWVAESGPGLATDSMLSWQWYENGAIPTLFGGVTPVGNPNAACTGVAAFPGAFYQTEINLDIGGPPYPILEASLTSPTIDVSDTECSALVLALDMYWRQLNGGTRLGSGAYLEYSIDDGMNWSDPIDLDEDGVSNGPTIDENRQFFLSNAGGTSTLKVRFIYDSDFYVLGIDNVRIYEPAGNDLRVQTNFLSLAPNLFQPFSQIENMAFLADIRNVGCLTQDSVILQMLIFDEDNNLMATLENEYGEVGGGETVENKVFQSVYRPHPITGQYTTVFNIISNNIDENLLDNAFALPFVISDDLMAKEDGGNSLTEPAPGNWDPGEFYSWGYGNYFNIPNSPDISMTLALTSVEFDLKPDAAYAGEIIDMVIYEWMDTNEDGIIQVGERSDIFVESLELDGTENGTIEVNPELELRGGNQALLVALEYFADDNDAVVFPLQFNTTWDYGATVLAYDSLATIENDPSIRRYAGFSFLEDNDQADYTSFTGFTGTPATIPIRIRLSPITSNETSLSSEHLITLSPNPVNDLLNINIDLAEMSEHTIITIYDITGKLIKQKEIGTIKRETITMSMSDFIPGSHLLQITSDI